jgi:undecaprenyl-diphosphatase
MDSLILRTLNSFSFRWPLLDKTAIFFADYWGYVLVFIILLFLVKDFKKYKLMVIEAFLAAVLARFGFTELIRFFLKRPRPFVENHINLLLKESNSPSFPSGHAAFFFGLSTIVYFYNKKAGIFFFIASTLMAIARVFCGVHWPGDILAGALIGIFSGWLVHKILLKATK